jgi:hypothetical protein
MLLAADKDKSKQTRNQLFDRIKNNADWQVGLVIIVALAFLAVKLFLGW